MEFKNSLAVFILLIMLVSMLSSCTYAVSGADEDHSIIYVSPDGNDSWNGLAPHWNQTTGNGPKKTIKSAMDQIDYGGTIKLTPGMYHENNINVDISVNIEGSGANNTHIDGKRGQVFYINADGQDGGKVVFKDFTIENAQTRKLGSAIYNWQNCELTILNCNFENNRKGGAIANDGSVLIDNCNFDSNNALFSGGAIINSGKMEIKDSDFISNFADNGGAIANWGDMVIKNSDFSSNAAYIYGGAVYTTDSLQIDNCKFDSNGIDGESGGTFEGRPSGGAIYNEGSLDVKNSEIMSNFVGATDYADGGDGGGIYSTDSLYVENCRFKSNGADRGGAIFADCRYLIIDNNLFTYNNAFTYGGAICKTANGPLGTNVFRNNTPDDVKIIQDGE